MGCLQEPGLKTAYMIWSSLHGLAFFCKPFRGILFILGLIRSLGDCAPFELAVAFSGSGITHGFIANLAGLLSLTLEVSPFGALPVSKCVSRFPLLSETQGLHNKAIACI